jgi:phenylpyruvate tautomerase PptA (4-oxalocrotonate tautomerase family)
MPLVRISLLKGKSRDYVSAISEGVHQAMVETYQVPPGDRFQLIHQHERDEFVYDPSYLGIQRTDDGSVHPHHAGNWRDTAAKKALYRAIADRLAKDPGIRPEDVQIVISSNERDEWSLGNGVASYVE